MCLRPSSFRPAVSANRGWAEAPRGRPNTSAAWAAITIALDRVAALSIAFLKDCAKACRPVALSFDPKRVEVVIPRRRAVTRILCAYPLPIQVGHLRLLRVENPSHTEISLAADSLCSETDNAKRS